jgi:hypothetical protein
MDYHGGMKKTGDIKEWAFQIVSAATGSAEPPKPPEPKPEKNPAAVALGRLGGLKGGKARAAKLSEKRRKEIAKKAAKVRWSKK